MTLALVLVLGTTGCEKLDSVDVGTSTVSPPLSMRDAIPFEYGDLVSVSPGELPGWELPFFQTT
jgi:hypothetical protein